MRKSKIKLIEIQDNSRRIDLDYAVQQAYGDALNAFGCDESGNFDYEDYSRGGTTLIVSFKGFSKVGSMGGQSWEYRFEAYLLNFDDEED